MNNKLSNKINDLDIKRSNSIYKNMKNHNLLSYYYKLKIIKNIKKLEISGSSPTDIFIGNFGYPKVYIGPLIPLEFNNTSILGKPELWKNMSIEKIINMRSKLIRGTYISNVHDVEKGKIQEQVRDLALAAKPIITEMSFLFQ